MKIILAGDWCWVHSEQSFADALRELGHDIVPFIFSDFFKGRIGHYQRALPFPGPALWALNRALLRKVEDERPDVVFLWNGTHVLPSSVKKIKACGIKIAAYSNDDPFGSVRFGRRPWHHHFLWKWYLRCVRHVDHVFVYRKKNIEEAYAFGATHVDVLRSYFVPKYHQPVELSTEEKQKFSSDIVFVGHYENDGRDAYLRALVKAGIHMRLFGGGYWTPSVLGDLASYFEDVPPVHGQDYAKALCGAKMCLCFLSKMNCDTYTRRCFEIPACGRLLLCERTDDLQNLFVEGQEAVFFSSKEELVEKAQWLLDHPEEIERIADAGRKRVWADGHDVVSRARHCAHALNG